MSIYGSDGLKTILPNMDIQLTQELREDAVNAGWPTELVEDMSVVFVRNSILIKYRYYRKEIEDIEYGDGANGPSPVIRSFMKKHGDEIYDGLVDWALDGIRGSGLIP
jgi:hypothetical protein